jgi:fermentation-respiration switch protein FrsA (DUF1100 family)
LRLKPHAMNIALGIGVGLVLFVVLVRAFENRLIFFPPRYPEGFARPESYGIHPDEVWLTTSDGVKLNAFFLPAPDSPTVLLWFHGNAENIGMGFDHLAMLSRLGVNVMELDYRGYGKSEGSPNEAGVYRDADAAYLYLTAARNFSPKNIYLYGHSLGGAVATDLASRRECGGLIVESSFTSVPDMARHVYRVPIARYLPRSRFDSVTKIARVQAPVLVIHGTRDAVVPFEMGRKLYQAARVPKMFLPIEGAEHDDPYLVGGEKYFKRITAFMQGSTSE